MDSLLIPFRSQPQAPRLREGYGLIADRIPSPDSLNRLLLASGDRYRDPNRWQLVLDNSLWHLGVESPDGTLVGFVRATSDLALNANLWDLCADPGILTRQTSWRCWCMAPSAGCAGSWLDAAFPCLHRPRHWPHWIVLDFPSTPVASGRWD